MSTQIDEPFSLDYCYLFVYFLDLKTWPPEIQTRLFVLKPAKIFPNNLYFKFPETQKDGARDTIVPKANILAIGDTTNGTVEIMGRRGKYTIINSDLFHKYCYEGIIQLKQQRL